jgi:hypothetical protein
MLILLEVEECISSDTFYKFMMFLHKIRGCRERDRMVVGFTTTCAISAYYHLGCVYEPHSGRGVLDTTLRDKVCQLILASGLSFYPECIFRLIKECNSSTNKVVKSEIKLMAFPLWSLTLCINERNLLLSRN